MRLRLTALYGGLFLVSGAGLLAITYLLVRHGTAGFRAPGSLPNTPPSKAAHLLKGARRSKGVFTHGVLPNGQSVAHLLGQQHAGDLHQLLIQSGVALVLMTVVSAALGWLVAGRVLAPLRTITAATRRISQDNLHDRLALQGPRDELRELADTIDALLARLDAAFEAQRRFVANASHELRTPLAMMRTRLDVAIGKPEGVPQQTQALDAGLRKDLDRADRMLESFLLLARAQHGTLTDHSPVSLDRVVIDALATRRDRIADQQLELQTALAPVRVAGSETLLARMVENVIENAVRHNQPRGSINISCKLDGDHARLVVDSGGPVLNQHSVAQLAQPFQRLGAERTGSRNGHGLGLSIVAAVAAAHGGTLQLHARAAGGLRVEINLPSATPAHTTPVPA